MLDIDGFRLIKEPCKYIHAKKKGNEKGRYVSGCTGAKRLVLDTLMMMENRKGLSRHQLAAKCAISVITASKWARELEKEDRIEVLKTANRITYKVKL